MKTIKLKFVGFWNSFDERENFITEILSSKYNIEFSEEPDFIIASVFGNPYEYCKYDCIRIFYSNEPYSPDMSLFDYAIGFDDFHLYGYDAEGNRVDRYHRTSSAYYCNHNYFCAFDKPFEFPDISVEEAKEILKAKTNFCSFITSHKTYDDGGREKLFKALSEYKKVDSAGTFMNNMPNGFVVPREKKIDFLKSYKFTISAESLSYPGFTTEKIIDAFKANAIPVYFGNPDVGNEFNKNSFIEVRDCNDLDEVVKKIIEIDQNDDLYISMLTQQKEIYKGYMKETYNDLKQFILDIFERGRVYMRVRNYSALWHNNRLRRLYGDRQFETDISSLKNKKIVLYGANNCGRDYYSQLQEEGCDAVLWADKDWERYKKMGLNVCSPNLIKTVSYDIILIAVKTERVANEIKQDLKKMGIEEDYILWQTPKILF